MVFQASKTLFQPPSTREIIFPTLNVMILQLIRNDCRDLVDIQKCKLATRFYGRSTKKVPNFAQFALLLKGVNLQQLWTQCGLRCLGINSILALLAIWFIPLVIYLFLLDDSLKNDNDFFGFLVFLVDFQLNFLTYYQKP